MVRLACLSALLTFASGCAIGPADGRSAEVQLEADEGTVWVVRTYQGGRQCGQEPYTPPDTAEQFAAAGVEVAEVVVQIQSTCRSCDCPAYAARHYARIDEADLLTARRLGFEEDTPSNRQDR